MDAMDWVDPVIQLTTAGGFGALVWYLVVKQIPQMETFHREERKLFMVELERRDAKLVGLVNEYHEVIQALLKDGPYVRNAK